MDISNFSVEELKKLNLNKNQATIRLGQFLTKKGKLDQIEYLLSIGADTNNDLNNYQEKIPYTIYEDNYDEPKKIISLFLKYGCNINSYGSHFETYLTSFIKFINKYIHYGNIANQGGIIDYLLFLLNRGLNPNGTIFSSTIRNLFRGYNNKFLFYKNLLTKIYTILISYGLNRDFCYIHVNQGINDSIPSTFKEMKDSLIIQQISFLTEYLNISDEDIINKCEDTYLLRNLARHYKITNYKDISDENTRKKICECIKKIRKNKSDYSEDAAIEIREKMRNINEKKKGYDQSKIKNTYLISTMESIDSFPPEEIVTLTNDLKFVHYFHVSEIPSLLEKGENLYTKEKLSQKFMDELINKYTVFASNTLEEILEDNNSVYPKIKSEINVDILIEFITRILKESEARYVHLPKLKNLNFKQIIELQNLLCNGNRVEINKTINPIHRPPQANHLPLNTLLFATLIYVCLEIKHDNIGVPNIMFSIIEQYLKCSELISPYLYNDSLRLWFTNSLNYSFGYKEWIKYIDTTDFIYIMHFIDGKPDFLQTKEIKEMMNKGIDFKNIYIERLKEKIKEAIKDLYNKTFLTDDDFDDFKFKLLTI